MVKPIIWWTIAGNLMMKPRKNSHFRKEPMSTRGKEYKQDRKYDRDGNIVPKVKVQRMYQKNYKHQRNK